MHSWGSLQVSGARFNLNSAEEVILRKEALINIHNKIFLLLQIKNYKKTPNQIVLNYFKK